MRYAVAAADQAAGNAAHGEAARLLERALDAAEAAQGLNDTGRVDLLTRVGTEHAKAGQAAEALSFLDHAAERARVIGSAEQLAEAVLARTTYAWTFEADTSERRLIVEALAAGPTTARTRARLLAANARMGAFSTEPVARKRADVEEAITAARAVGDPETLGAALMSSVYLGCGPDDLAERRLLLDELIAAARAANRPDWEAMRWSFQASLHLTLGQYEQAQTAEAQLERVTLHSRDPFAAVAFGEIASRRACINGDFAEAERHAGEQLALSQRIGISEPALATVAGLYLAVWNLQDRYDDIDELLRAFTVPNDGEWKRLIDLWTASLRARQGRMHEAATALGPAGTPLEHGRNWGGAVEDATTAIVHLDDPDRAEALLEQLWPYCDLDCTLETIQYRGAVAHHIGRLLTTCKRNDEAVEQLAKAHDRYTALGSPPWLAIVERDIALARRGT